MFFLGMGVGGAASFILFLFIFGASKNDREHDAYVQGYEDGKKSTEQWNTRKPIERIVERLEKRKKQLEELYKSGYGTTLEQLQCNDFLITTENDIRIVKEEGGIE